MNFNTNFKHGCCNNRPSFCWQNPCFCRPNCNPCQPPRPPKCDCRCHWNCNPCCNNRKWDNCRDNNWSRQEHEHFEREFEEREYDGFNNNNFPEDFGFERENFERFDDFDRFDGVEEFNRRPCKDDRKCCHHNNCGNNCGNCCFQKNALCILAGCLIGRNCR